MTPTQTSPVPPEVVTEPSEAAVVTQQPGVKLCPHCGSDNIRESSTRRGMDLLPANIGKDPYRCRSCRGRFYLKRESDTTPTGAGVINRRKHSHKRDPLWKHPSLKRHKNEISIAVGSLVTFAGFLYLLARSGIAF